MKQFLFSARLPDGNEVCIAPVSADVFNDNDVDSLGDDTGYFIYEYDPQRSETGIEILAKAASYEAAIRITDIFLSVQQKSHISNLDQSCRGALHQFAERPESITHASFHCRCDIQAPVQPHEVVMREVERDGGVQVLDLL